MQNDENPNEQTPIDTTNTETSEMAPPETSETVTKAPSQAVVSHHRNPHKRMWWLLGILVVVALILAAYVFGTRKATAPTATTTTKSSQTARPSTTSGQLTLDTSKDYGNKYKDGLLPVGDGKYSTTSASAGTVYVCSGYANNLQTQSGGAGKPGPWFSNNNTQYDINKKAHVQGNVNWTSQFSNSVSGSSRIITSNDLPNHTTGVYPIAASDPAYAYDKNPNSIKAQMLSYNLPTNPTYKTTPGCMGGQSGIMLTGIALFNGFDAGGRDAGAWEVQDSCSGHPEKEGLYHYHTLSSCIKDISVKTVIGYALDGFPITGPQLAPNNILTTTDLDACHGITSSYIVDGKTVSGYHYVMTQDFPYSVSCFRSTATTPPGQPQPNRP